jgi:hypothetical protein
MTRRFRFLASMFVSLAGLPFGLIPNAFCQHQKVGGRAAVSGETRARITLSRRSGFFGGSTYTVMLDDHGHIEYTGSSGVVVRGEHAATTTPAVFRHLLSEVRAAKLETLRNQPLHSINDGPTSFLEIEAPGIYLMIPGNADKGISRRVSVESLEGLVDEAVGSDRWVRGTKEVIPLLRAETYNFHADDASLLLAAAARRGDLQSFDELEQLGVSANQLPQDRLVHEAATGGNPLILAKALAGCACLAQDALEGDAEWAARSGDTKTLQLLLSNGAALNGTESDDSPLISAAMNCQAITVEYLLQQHAVVGKKHEGTPINLLPTGYYGGGDPAKCVQTLAVLKNHGIDLKETNNLGNTALHLATDPLIAGFLLQSGLDVNARNTAGQTPIFTTTNKVVRELLIRSGADIHARDNAGHTFEEVTGRH